MLIKELSSLKYRVIARIMLFKDLLIKDPLYILGISNVKIKNLCIPYSKSQLNVLFAQFMSLLLKKSKN